MLFLCFLIFLVLFYWNCCFFKDIIRSNKSTFFKIVDLSNFKCGQIVGARMAGANVTKTAEFFVCVCVARSIVLKVMAAFEKEGKTSSLKQNSGRKRELSDRDHRTLMQIVRNDYMNTAPKFGAIYINKATWVSSSIIRCPIHSTLCHIEQKSFVN